MVSGERSVVSTTTFAIGAAPAHDRKMLTIRRITMLGAAVVLAGALAGADTLPSATTLLDQAKAQAQAAKDHRAIFAIFHASW